MDQEPLSLAQVEPKVHVPARLEGRNDLFGHRDLGAIARVSSRARVPLLDREHAKAAQFNPIPTRSPCASAVVIVSRMALTMASTSRWYRCGFCSAIPSISSGLIMRASGRAISQALLVLLSSHSRGAPGWMKRLLWCGRQGDWFCLGVSEPVTEFDRRPFEHPLLSPGTVAGQLRSASVPEHVR